MSIDSMVTPSGVSFSAGLRTTEDATPLHRFITMPQLHSFDEHRQTGPLAVAQLSTGCIRPVKGIDIYYERGIIIRALFSTTELQKKAQGNSTTRHPEVRTASSPLPGLTHACADQPSAGPLLGPSRKLVSLRPPYFIFPPLLSLPLCAATWEGPGKRSPNKKHI